MCGLRYVCRLLLRPGNFPVVMPYELLPYPEEGEKGTACGRDGQPLCEAEVISCRTSPAFDKTALLSICVPKDMSMRARFFRREEK